MIAILLLAFQMGRAGDPLNVPVPDPASPVMHDASSVNQFSLYKGPWLTGTIQLEGGDKMPYPPLVVSNCGAPVRSTWTTFQVAATSCLVGISVPGYRSAYFFVRDRAVVVLKRLGEHEGSSISITALQTPVSARKSFDQGRLAAYRKNWTEAARAFKKSLAIYSENANAWDELGAAQEFLGDAASARESYRRAASLDPRFIKPHVHLARLELAANQPASAMAAAQSAIRLIPLEFPQVYLYHAMAAATLERYDIAEDSAAKAIEWDTQHEYPRAEYLLATLLQRRGDKNGALRHYRTFLERAPAASDAAAVGERIKLLENSP